MYLNNVMSCDRTTDILPHFDRVYGYQRQLILFVYKDHLINLFLFFGLDYNKISKQSQNIYSKDIVFLLINS